MVPFGTIWYHFAACCMKLCRGPLPDGHPRAGVTYFCPDQDVAPQACNLSCTPVVQNFLFTEGEAVLLDAHRAPDEWFACACRMPRLTVQGDPEAHRPRKCSRFAAELEKAALPVAALLFAPHLQLCGTLMDAMPHARGRTVVLAGSHDSRNTVFEMLRPSGLQRGDGVMDFYGRYAAVESADALHVHVDGGRRVLRRGLVNQHVVVSPSCVRSGEYDTVIVMPDVPESIGRAICRRTRYRIIAVAHSPYAYVQQSAPPLP